MTAVFALIYGASVWAASCAPPLTPLTPAAINHLLDPARTAEEVHAELHRRQLVKPVTSLDRALVTRVAARCCVGGLDPELAWPVDGRWMLYRDPPRPPRLFTLDLKFEVNRPDVASTLNQRVATYQSTRVTPSEIISTVSLHRLDSACRVRRRIQIDARDYLAPALTLLGTEDAAPAVKRTLDRLGIVETSDAARAQRTLSVPRFSRWASRLTRLGPAVANVRFTELILSTGLTIHPGEIHGDGLFESYLWALANGTVPIILDRWELDEPLRHALGALLVPPSTLRWYQTLAARLIDARGRADPERESALDYARAQVIRQFMGVLDVGALVLAGEVDDFATFRRLTQPVWPGLTLPLETKPGDLLIAHPNALARSFRANVLDEDEGVAPAGLVTIHREFLKRRAALGIDR